MTRRIVKKSICLIIPTLCFGGAERVFVDLANAFAAQGHIVSLIVLSKGNDLLDRVHPSVSLFRLQKRGVLHSLPTLLHKLKVISPQVVLSTLGHLNVVLGLCRRLGLFSCNTLLLREANIPSLAQRGSLSSNLIARMYPGGYRSADWLIAQSQDMKNDLQKNFSIDSSRIRVIHNPINMAEVQRRSQEEIPFKSSHKTLLFVGSLSARKQVDHLLHALTFPVLADVVLHLVGDGEERGALEMLAENLEIQHRVVFHGLQPNPYAFMRQADATVLTSAFEGLPNVLIEAIAVGTPICSYNNPGGASEIVSADNGILVEPCTPREFSCAIQKLFTRSLTLEQIQSTASAFDTKTIVEQYTALF